MSKNLEKQSSFEKLHANVTKRWLTPDELESEYGFSKSNQAKMKMSSNRLKIPFTKVSKYIRYDRLAIDKWLEEHSICSS